MKNKIGTLLLAFFAVGSLFIYVGGAVVLFSAASSQPAVPAPPSPPTPPDLAGLDRSKSDADTRAQVDAMTQRVTLFGHRTAAYQHTVTAYKEYLTQLQQKTTYAARIQNAYTAVVTNPVVSLISTLITALVGYAFVKGSATVAAAYLAAKHHVARPDVDL